MNVADLRRDHEHAVRRAAELSAEVAAIGTAVETLRATRTKLLAPAGLGAPGASKELERVTAAIRLSLQKQRETTEAQVEVYHHGQLLRWKLLETVMLEELDGLPKIESALAGALKPVAKVLAGLDLGDAGSLSRGFVGPRVGQFQATGSRIREEISKALQSALAALLENPQAETAVSLAGVDLVCRDVVSACDHMRRQTERRLATRRTEAALARAEQERLTAV